MPLKIDTSKMSEEEKVEMLRLQKKREKRQAKLNKKKEDDAEKKRGERWAIECIEITKERTLMKKEDVLAYAIEIRERQYNFMKFLNNLDKVKRKTDKAKQEALAHSNKQVGKLVNKGWFDGAEIDVVSPNVLNEYVGHDKGVKHFWVSKDERLIFSASDDHTIIIWDLVKATILGTMHGHQGFVNRISVMTEKLPDMYHPQPKTVISTSQDFSIRKWNASLRGNITHEKAMHVEKSAHSEPIHSLDVSKDGNYLATCSSDKTIAIWETRRMRKLHTFYGHMDIVTAVSFSPNGKHLVSAGGTFDPTIKLWDAEIYKMLPPKEYPPEIVGINKGFYKSIPVNGGKSIMHERTEKSSHGRDFDVENEVEDGQVEENAPDNDDHLKGNGARKNRRRGKGSTNIEGRGDHTPSNGSSSSDNSSSVAEDEFSNEKDTKAGRRRKEQRIRDKQMMDNNGLIDTKMMWESKEDKERSRKDELLLRGGLILTFDVKKYGMEWYGHTGWINMVKYSNSGRRIASCSVDHKIKLWKPKDGTLSATFTGHTDWVMAVTWSPDDRRLISSGADHSVRIWDVGTRNLLKVLNGHEDVVYYAEELLSGRILSSSMDTIIKLWQIKPVPPYPITTLRIAKVEQHAIEIEWEAPPAMGDRIIGYIIQRREGAPNPDDDAVWGNQVNLGIIETLQLRIDNLTPGISYQLRIASKNKIGMSNWSDPSRWARTYAAEPLRVHPAPSVVTVTKRTMALSWLQPKDMGAHILSIRLQRRGGDIREFGDVPDTVISIKSARQGAIDVANELKVRAKADLKKMRIKEDMKEIEKRRLRVRRKMLKIEVKKKRKALLETKKMLKPGAGAMLATVVSGLMPGILYQYRVCAVNRVGAGPWSRCSFSTATSATIPDAPEEVHIVESRIRNLIYAWKSPYDNGAIVTAFRLRYRLSSLESMDKYVRKSESKQVSTDDVEKDERKDEGGDPDNDGVKWTLQRLNTIIPLQRQLDYLEPGHTYEIQMAAINSEGQSKWCDSLFATTNTSVPVIPDVPFPIAETATKMRIHFRRPYHNGSPVSQYKIRWKKDGRESGSIFTEKFEVSISDEDCYDYCPKNIIDLEFERNQRLKRRRDASTEGDGEGETGPNEPNGWRSVLISGLEASTVYEFVVSAANDKGFCEFSIPSDEVPTKRAKEPNTMDAPILSEETTNSIDLAWEVPFHNGAKIITYGYACMDVDQGYFNEPVVFEELERGATKATVTGLTAGRTYAFRIAAINKVGQGKWSPVSEQLRCPTKTEYVLIAHKRKQEREAREALKEAEKTD